MEKVLKLKSQKVFRENSREGVLFARSPPPILNRVKNDLADSRPVKTIKKEKYRI